MEDKMGPTLIDLACDVVTMPELPFGKALTFARVLGNNPEILCKILKRQDCTKYRAFKIVRKNKQIEVLDVFLKKHASTLGEMFAFFKKSKNDYFLDVIVETKEWRSLSIPESIRYLERYKEDILMQIIIAREDITLPYVAEIIEVTNKRSAVIEALHGYHDFPEEDIESL